jgi:hypothetical protein
MHDGIECEKSLESETLVLFPGHFGAVAPLELIGRRLLDVIDDEYLYRRSRRFQLESKLLLHGREDRRPINGRIIRARLDRPCQVQRLQQRQQSLASSSADPPASWRDTNAIDLKSIYLLII